MQNDRAIRLQVVESVNYIAVDLFSYVQSVYEKYFLLFIANIV